jgi:parvulin-like peptidyl-prolyl isomerase
MRTASARAAALLVAVALPAGAEEINRIVLRVNDEIATLHDYEQRRAARLAAIASSAELSLDERRRLSAEAGRATLREIFEELLVLSRAQQLRIEATPAKIDRAVEQTRRRFGLASDEDLADAVAQSGGTMEEFRARLARNLLFSEVVQREVSPKVDIDPEEVARYWREHPEEFAVPERRRVQEAVVREDGSLTATAREELAARLRDAIVGGRSVAEAVADAAAAGEVLVLDHEWIERGTLDASLESAVWKLAAGGVAGPLPARGGLHVLHLLEVRPPSTRPLEEVRERILGRLQEAEFERRSAEFLDELARTALVVEHLPEDAVGYRTAATGDRDPVRALLRRGGEEKPAAPPAADEPPPAVAEPAVAPPPPAA